MLTTTSLIPCAKGVTVPGAILLCIEAFHKWFSIAMLGTGLMVAWLAVFVEIKGAACLACSAFLVLAGLAL